MSLEKTYIGLDIMSVVEDAESCTDRRTLECDNDTVGMAGVSYTFCDGHVI